jgi:hypothetical protein
MTYVCKVAQASDPYQASSASSPGASEDGRDSGSGVPVGILVLLAVVMIVVVVLGLLIYKRREAHRRAIAGQAEGTSLKPVTNAPTYVVGVALASQGDV